MFYIVFLFKTDSNIYLGTHIFYLSLSIKQDQNAIIKIFKKQNFYTNDYNNACCFYRRNFFSNEIFKL